MVTYVRHDIKLKRQDSVKDLCFDSKFNLQTIEETTVCDLTINYFMSKRKLKYFIILHWSLLLQ